MLYHHLKKMEKSGWVVSSVEQQSSRPARQVYDLTESGRAELNRWLSEPVKHTREIRLEFLVKLYFARRTDPDLAVALVAGIAVGLVNGLLITKLGIEAFIVTLGSMGIYRSLVTWLADGGTLSLDFGLRTFYQPVYYGGILGISWPIIVFAVVVVLGEILMRATAFGRHCAAIGSNDQVARYSAVRVARVRRVPSMMLAWFSRSLMIRSLSPISAGMVPTLAVKPL